MDLQKNLPLAGSTTQPIEQILSSRQPPRKLITKNVILSFLSLFVLAALVVGSILLVRQDQDIRQQASSGNQTGAGQCLAIKAYVKNGQSQWVETPWNQLATKVALNDTVRFAVSGTAGAFQKARFRVNYSSWAEVSSKNTAQEYIYDYKLTGYGDLNVEAELLEL